MRKIMQIPKSSQKSQKTVFFNESWFSPPYYFYQPQASQINIAWAKSLPSLLAVHIIQKRISLDTIIGLETS
jgi:hypothetical protein